MGRDIIPENHGALSEKQKLLIERYFDGECGLYSRWRAERLVDSNTGAAQYLEALTILAEQYRAVDREVSEPPVDFGGEIWTVIERRIEQEEKAAFLLGERQVAQRKGRFSRLAALLSEPFQSFGHAGAFAAASLLVVTALGLYVSLSPSTPAQLAETDSIYSTEEGADVPGRVEPIRSHTVPRVQVASSGNSLSSTPVPVEVDWMRSSGRVHLFQPRSDRGPVIFVKPRKRIVRPEQSRSISAPTARFASE